MNAFLFPASLVSPLGWTLLHFLWQGAAIALAYAVAQWALRRSSANARYLVGCVALVLVVLAPTLTLEHLSGQPVKPARPVPRPVTQTISLPPEVFRTQISQKQVSLAAQPQPRLQTGVSAKSIPRPAQPPQIGDHFNRVLPWIVGGWGLGVFVLTLHLLMSWYQVRRIKGRSTLPPGEPWCSRLESLRHKLAVSRPVRLLQSACVEVPTVIGYLSPVILVPASALTGLTTQQLELLLAHELAHIRRHDYLVNALQNIVEILLFYHPAVWWISRRVREEREHCCDDLAVATCGDRLEYVRALATMEELRGLSPAWTIGASGGSLVQRVRRLLRAPDPSPNPAGWWVTGLVILTLVIGLGGARWNSAVAKDTPESSSDATAAGWSKTLKNGIKVEEAGLSKDYRVLAQGTIELPLPGSVDVAGRDTQSIAAEIKRRLDTDYLQDCAVTVEWTNRVSTDNRGGGTPQRPVPSSTNGSHRFELRFVAKEEDTGPCDELPDPKKPDLTLRFSRPVLFDETAIESASIIRSPLRNLEEVPQDEAATIYGDFADSLPWLHTRRFVQYGEEIFVQVGLNPSSTLALSELTASSIGRQLAVVFDRKVLAAFVIGDRVVDGKVPIHGDYTSAEASAIAKELNSFRHSGAK